MSLVRFPLSHTAGFSMVTIELGLCVTSYRSQLCERLRGFVHHVMGLVILYAVLPECV
jgi:hypothetical protein